MSFVEVSTAQGNHSYSGDSSSAYPQYVGFITAGVAVVIYGSVFVPIKKVETGDGMFFQWFFCTGIWLTGVVLQLVRQSTFYPLVMVGGAIWTTGNTCVVPVIKTIGMGLGVCIWNTFNLLTGWATGRFGLFGIKPEVPSHEALNYVGVALAVTSSIIYVFVKNDITPPDVEMIVGVDEQHPLIDQRSSVNADLDRSSPDEETTSFIDKLSPGYKRVIGVVLSILSGILYGLNVAPFIYVQDNYEGASQNSLDYLFSHYCGIFLSSSAYFLLYCVLKRNKPVVYPKAILPATASGIMWALASMCAFVAIKSLSEPVSFPIVTTVPSAIASLFWGVCIFKEIKGKRNISVLLIAFAFTAAGAVLAGVSK